MRIMFARMTNIKKFLVPSAALLTLSIIFLYTATQPEPVKTFSISFAIGISGAFVYMFILLMTDRTLEILRNDMLPLWVMVMLFTISGGIVAGVTQTATGSAIATNNVHNIFMVGFGWQGVISGAGGSSKVAGVKEKDVEFKKLLEDLEGGK